MSDEDDDLTSEIGQFLEQNALFLEALADCGRRFRSSSSALERRQAVLAAIHCLIIHFDAEDAPREAVSLFEALYGEIQNISQGREISFLERDLAPHAPRRSAQADTVLVFATAALDLLVHSRRPLRDAAQHVARRLIAKKLWPFDASEALPHVALVNFRKWLHSKKGDRQLQRDCLDAKQAVSGKPVQDA